MKKIRYLLIIICGILTNSCTMAQEVKGDKVIVKDLVVELPKADLHKTIPVLKFKLRQLEGVSFEGYCDSRKLLFIKTKEESYFNVLMLLKEINLIYYIKQHTSILRAKTDCMSQKEIETSFSGE
jgi:hypothetical protein